ncbi:MAG: hypothetical protein JKY42_07455 [Flavobacteriales bacterium]|nr:hypothetical protein [Flavobacteriales bacterium]
MVKNAIISLFVALLWGSSLFAQVEELNKAVEALTVHKITEAKKHIDAATLNPETANLPETWYYRMYIYKDLYKANEQADRFSPARDESIRALTYFLTLDNRDQFEASALKMGKYLVSSYYNNAVVDLQNEFFEYSQTNYKKYKQSYSLIEPTRQFGNQDIKYQLALANGFMVLYESDRIVNDKHYAQAKVTYEEVIGVEPDNWNANYNLGILIYNRAVSIIKSMDYDTDLYEVDQLQAECVKLFFSSLPYMKKAHELNPSLFEPIAGLTGIYFSLHEEEQYSLYKGMLGGNGY